MSLSPERLALEAVPVAAVLLFWNALAWIAQTQGVGGPVRDAGLVMAALYVVVRGVALADRAAPPAMIDTEAVVAENARVAVAAGAWFLAAMVAAGLEAWVYGLRELVAVAADSLAGAGLGVVGLYAVASGYARLGGVAGDGAVPDAPTDDEPPEEGASADD